MNKFNIGDNVIPTYEKTGMYKENLTYYSWYEVYKYENGIVDTYPEGNKEYSWSFSDSEISLIEQDTKDLQEKLNNQTLESGEPTSTIKAYTPTNPTACASLDYEYEYNKLLEENEELKELHEIALMMIKLGSELL
jgi:hypothetical protein